MWSFPSLESIGKDIRFALRSLRRAPGFAIVVVVTLAVAIGANTAIFSLVNATLVRGLPYPEADRLVLLIGTVQRQTVERRFASYPDFLDWRAQATGFTGMAAASPSSFAPILLLGAVALLACAVPALRASRVDPVDALRVE